jgi:two-component system NtrC family response regulator
MTDAPRSPERVTSTSRGRFAGRLCRAKIASQRYQKKNYPMSVGESASELAGSERQAIPANTRAIHSPLRIVEDDPGLPRSVDGGESMQGVWRMVAKLAATDVTVLLLGESGTGKERLARALHDLSPRAAMPWVAINCAAIPEGLLESELFGHERGAFTGASAKKGKIEQANGGTLFLDEIGDLPFALQAKLLRFLEERTVERLGAREAIPVDLRIVAATNQKLEEAIARGTLRLDLYYRINGISITVPPLRERGSDCAALATLFLTRARAQRKTRATAFAPDALAAIEAHRWPGNVRELENRVSRAAIMAESSLISARDLELAEASADEAPPNLRAARQCAEMQTVRRALALTGGNISAAARMLGVSRQTFYKLMTRTPGK